MATSPGFVQRLITVQFGTADGSQFSGGGNTMTLSGHRVTCRIVQPGLFGYAELAIYGMQRRDMNELSTLGMLVLRVGRHNVVVTAGNAGASPATVFQGNIISAWFDAQSAPDVMLRVSARTGLVASVAQSNPKSFPGTIDVAGVLSQLASEMGFQFENNGVSVSMRTPYLHGSALDQAQQLAEAACIYMALDKNTLAIWPIKGADGLAGHRTVGIVPVISPATGMIAYPSFDAMGVMVKTMFNPDIVIGGQIEIQQNTARGSSAPPSLPSAANPTARADGIWNVYKLDHSLDSLMPNGMWQTVVSATNPQNPLAIASS